MKLGREGVLMFRFVKTANNINVGCATYSTYSWDCNGELRTFKHWTRADWLPAIQLHILSVHIVERYKVGGREYEVAWYDA